MDSNKKKKTDINDDQELKEKLQLLEAKSQEYLAGWQRAKADYANLQKDNEKRAKDLMEIINAAFMAEILPIYNYFKMSLKHVPIEQKESDWVKGIFQIQKQFKDFLNKYKIEEIKTVGEKFDPSWHEAVVCEEKTGITSGIIFEEIEPGYSVDGKLLNPAKVKVAK